MLDLNLFREGKGFCQDSLDMQAPPMLESKFMQIVGEILASSVRPRKSGLLTQLRSIESSSSTKTFGQVGERNSAEIQPCQQPAAYGLVCCSQI